MAGASDDVKFAHEVNRYIGQTLHYFDMEGNEKSAVFYGIQRHRGTKQFIAHFRRSNVVSQFLLHDKTVPLRRVLLPSSIKHEDIGRGRKTSGNTSRTQTRNSFQYYNDLYQITRHWQAFKSGDEVVWSKCNRNNDPCMGKILVTAEREDVVNGSTYQEVAVVKFEEPPITQTGTTAPGSFSYLSGVKFTYVIPMRELLTLSEWIAITTNEIVEDGEDEWTLVGRNGKAEKSQPKTEIVKNSDYDKDFNEKRDKHGKKQSVSHQEDSHEFSPKGDDDWQQSLNKVDFFNVVNDGVEMGVQGHNNSCYMDSSLFALFSFNKTLDSSLVQLKNEDVQQISSKVKKVLRNSIIFPMRNRFYVPFNHVRKLRKILGKQIKQEYLSQHMDIEEFITDLFNLMGTSSFLNYDNDEGDYLHQITLPFTWEANQHKAYLTLQSLLENSFETFEVKLAKRPEGVFIMKLPVSDGVLIPCIGVIPNLTLDLRKLLAAPGTMSRDNTVMHLHAVICLRQNHFVTFVRTAKGGNAPWVFMDSKPTTQTPYISLLSDVDESIMHALSEVMDESQSLNIRSYEPKSEKFGMFRNAYICIYV